jgi:hypothetical protein
MNNEFDFDNEDLGFEDFGGEFEEFDEFDDDEVFVRTAVLSKNNMIALLCVKTAKPRPKAAPSAALTRANHSPLSSFTTTLKKPSNGSTKVFAQAAKTAGRSFTTGCRCRARH